MSRGKVDLEALRRAFVEREESPEGDEEHPSATTPAPEPSEIWAAVRGDLDHDRLLELLDQSAEAPERALEWRIARELQEEVAEKALDQPSTSNRSHWSRPVALAASLVVATLIAVFFIVPRDRDPAPYRQPGEMVVESLLQPGEALSPDQPFLRWTSLEGARYEVSVLRSDTGSEIFRATELEQPRIQLPASVWDEVPANRELLWRVEAILPSGEHVASRTFRARLLKNR